MLQIKNVSKMYITGELYQTALNNVSLNLRDNEFVSVLGPSGSGKTTLLNVIGGLDQYDSGDLVINGISTQRYRDRDWDSYRNHTIGFVFQSYNLIPHQTILSNVELALTISGISKSERKKRAVNALTQVGLGDQVHKRPNQLSGGQMQRVAIARALVNNPSILLADEPTGALDTETSVQIMQLLKQVANDRLVVMVTHNAELAEEYSTRIVKLKDGMVTDDSNPYIIDDPETAKPEHKTMGKASMSFLTALSLSFNNLRTKKGRTFLTSFAGSIGIIGISLILALSNGVNTYITDIQRDTMTSYPIMIDAQAFDLNSMMSSSMKSIEGKSDHKHDAVYTNNTNIEMTSTMMSNIKENNLTKFKKYLDDKESDIHKYLQDNDIVYSYNVNFDTYVYDSDKVLVNTSGDDFYSKASNSISEAATPSAANGGDVSVSMGGTKGIFSELLPGDNNNSVGTAITDNYELLHGKWPQKYNEVVLVLDKNNEIDTSVLYKLGLLPSEEYKDIIEKTEKGEDVKLKNHSWSYEEICKQDLYSIPACDYYTKDTNGAFKYIGDDTSEVEKLIDSSLKLKITGVIKINEDSQNSLINNPVGYTKALTEYIIDYTDKSPVVKAQKDSPEKNVLNGMSFKPANDEQKAKDAKEYLSNLNVSQKAEFYTGMMSQIYINDKNNLQALNAMNENERAAMLDNYLKNPDKDMLISFYDKSISSGSYDENMTSFGVVSVDAPSSISLYADTFEDKDYISECIDDYNLTVDEADKITYTDYVGLMISSITTIINVVSYVLIAFVAVSLVVSSIMIGIITYISVLERTKEIGILRAIGASKKNISQVFNAETVIIGLCAGLIGIGVSCLLIIPTNAIIHALVGSELVNASLPVMSAIILIVLSVVLTLIGGLIPAKKAARKDPVTALRTD